MKQKNKWGVMILVFLIALFLVAFDNNNLNNYQQSSSDNLIELPDPNQFILTDKELQQNFNQYKQQISTQKTNTVTKKTTNTPKTNTVTKKTTNTPKTNTTTKKKTTSTQKNSTVTKKTTSKTKISKAASKPKVSKTVTKTTNGLNQFLATDDEMKQSLKDFINNKGKNNNANEGSIPEVSSGKSSAYYYSLVQQYKQKVDQAQSNLDDAQRALDRAIEGKSTDLSGDGETSGGGGLVTVTQQEVFRRMDTLADYKNALNKYQSMYEQAQEQGR